MSGTTNGQDEEVIAIIYSVSGGLDNPYPIYYSYSKDNPWRSLWMSGKELNTWPLDGWPSYFCVK
ncbi:MAG: hypothetical protein UX60_C0004G0008 [Berkelbacteria bacterium GW2011_GWA2_46_7]|uniref:Uncharacterized protein n=1 Tax=Berkelbacteria bacterium GW2011_GWA2_46_7 TaxID=1618335 RepID=A0A0G1QHJ4_9BACT|nr:MAG: hypothetical protein UX60_C0004G0008 [Berkelbacteria bacterium GW2011_GWA2_46_7]